ncbi:acetoacetate decarboxylase family protein [uncultured Marinobacter sp.]|uniref:acetoacetate decarboxylase family protein n=1 Tax=uncultured Marinobacter sp. TaxID=187379 RepID=UPI002600FF8A|nr:acetoacetate decarboxylase family protein [uncultured Marinobacter sp.]
MSSFVKTQSELEEIQGILSRGRCTVEQIAVEFETTFDFLRSVLPPCFDLPDEPTAIASVSRWQSELCGEYDCGIISLNCKYRDLVGSTMLVLTISGDMPFAIGREMWGEAKKVGEAKLYKDGNDCYAFSERKGVRLIEIEADLHKDLGPSEAQNWDFELKAIPHSSGWGLQHDVVVNCMQNQERNRVTKEGHASLKLRGTDWDPLHTIPIVKTGKAFYTEGESSWTVPRSETVEGRDQYLPFVYGQKYDDFRLFKTPKRFLA